MQIRKCKDQPNIMKYIQLYLGATLILYIFGPIQWKTKNPILTISLLIVFQLSYALGFYSSKEKEFIEDNNFNNKWLLKYYCLFAVISIAMNVVYLIRVARLVAGRSVFDVISMAFTNPSGLYGGGGTVTSSQMFGGKFFAILVPVFGPITVAIIPITIVYFKQLSLMGKTLGVFSFVSQLFLSLSAGTSEGIVNIIIYLITGFLLKNRSNRKSNRKITVIIIITAVVVFLSLFSFVMENRNKGSFSLSLGGNKIDFNNALLMMLPENLKALLIYLTIYITQGYYGMSLATACSWTPTFGIGNSLYIIQNVEELFNFDLMSYTYMGQAEVYGWGATVNWHTAYTWIANDVSFWGVPVVMFFMGRLLRQVLCDARTTKNPIAIGLSAMLIMFSVFIPANNKILAAPQTFVAFFVFLIIWIFQRRVVVLK